MAYCFYDNGISQMGVKSLGHVDTDKENESHKRCVNNELKQFQRVPPLPTLYLVMEIQNVVSLPTGPQSQAKVLPNFLV